MTFFLSLYDRSLRCTPRHTPLACICRISLHSDLTASLPNLFRAWLVVIWKPYSAVFLQLPSLTTRERRSLRLWPPGKRSSFCSVGSLSVLISTFLVLLLRGTGSLPDTSTLGCSAIGSWLCSAGGSMTAGSMLSAYSTRSTADWSTLGSLGLSPLKVTSLAETPSLGSSDSGIWSTIGWKSSASSLGSTTLTASGLIGTSSPSSSASMTVCPRLNTGSLPTCFLSVSAFLFNFSIIQFGIGNFVQLSRRIAVSVSKAKKFQDPCLLPLGHNAIAGRVRLAIVFVTWCCSCTSTYWPNFRPKSRL